jgi:hypothetical protein
MGELASTILGGSIAAISGSLTIFLTDWLNRRHQRTTLEREALVEWASAYEGWVSLYNDYMGLVLGRPDPPNAAYEKTFLERMNQSGEAGRRLDIAKYRILIVERRDWVCDEITRLTKASEVHAQTSSSDLRTQASAFRGAAGRLRSDLEIFLRRLAGKTGPPN